MPSEKVLFHSDTENVTVTSQRLIYGDDVTEIAEIKHAFWTSSNRFRDYLIAIAFTAIGIPLVFTFSGWSLLGGILLLNPLLVFFVKNKYWVFIFLKSGSTVDEGADSKRMFPKDVAKGVSDAINQAVQLYRVEHDPRQGLNL